VIGGGFNLNKIKVYLPETLKRVHQKLETGKPDIPKTGEAGNFNLYKCISYVVISVIHFIDQ
jgi:hypothetical protein